MCRYNLVGWLKMLNPLSLSNTVCKVVFCIPMKTPVYYWLKAFADLDRKGLFGPSIGIITRMEARLSLNTKFEDSDGPGGNWKWPGDQAGVAGFEHADGTPVPDSLHIIAHYHDNYFDVVRLFSDLQTAELEYTRLEQREFDDEVKPMLGSPEGAGLFKMSKYHCEVNCLEDGRLTRPDKGSTWALLPHINICLTDC